MTADSIPGDSPSRGKASSRPHSRAPQGQAGGRAGAGAGAGALAVLAAALVATSAAARTRGRLQGPKALARAAPRTKLGPNVDQDAVRGGCLLSGRRSHARAAGKAVNMEARHLGTGIFPAYRRLEPAVLVHPSGTGIFFPEAPSRTSGEVSSERSSCLFLFFNRHHHNKTQSELMDST